MKSRKSLLKHKKEFHSGKTFPCQICSKSFPRPDYLKKHKEKEHLSSMTASSSIAPSICPSSVVVNVTLSNPTATSSIHQSSTVSNLTPSTSTDVSSTNFNSVVSISDKESFPCDLCNRVFAQESILSVHLANVHKRHQTDSSSTAISISKEVISNCKNSEEIKLETWQADFYQPDSRKMSRPNLLEMREFKPVQKEEPITKLSDEIKTSQHVAAEKLTEMTSTKRPSSSTVIEATISENHYRSNKWQSSQNVRKITSISHEQSRADSKTNHSKTHHKKEHDVQLTSMSSPNSSASLSKTDKTIFSKPINDLNQETWIANSDQPDISKKPKPSAPKISKFKPVQEEVLKANETKTSKQAEKPLIPFRINSIKKTPSSVFAERSEKCHRPDKVQSSQIERKMTANAHEQAHIDSKTDHSKSHHKIRNGITSNKRPTCRAVAEISEKRQKPDNFQRSQNERKMKSKSHERSHYDPKTDHSRRHHKKEHGVTSTSESSSKSSASLSKAAFSSASGSKRSEQPFPCDICNRRCENEEFLAIHLWNVHKIQWNVHKTNTTSSKLAIEVKDFSKNSRIPPIGLKDPNTM